VSLCVIRGRVTAGRVEQLVAEEENQVDPRALDAFSASDGSIQ
jgi:hypothetical protein